MNMPTKAPSTFFSILSCKCPRCRSGKVFPYPAMDFRFHKTNDYCPKCNLKFEHETGFFWGAMYISYAFSTVIMIAFGIVAINSDWSFSQILWVLIPLVLFLTPFSYRYSRIFLLYFISPNRKFDSKYLN